VIFALKAEQLPPSSVSERAAPFGIAAACSCAARQWQDRPMSAFLFESSKKRIGFHFPMNPTITVDGQVGYLFESEKTGSYCFVPQDQIRFADDGKAVINEVQYFKSGWALRNMRSTSSDRAGTYLFPNLGRLITNVDSVGPRRFLSTVASHSSHPFPAHVVRPA
jgi:hypothetical protein